MTSHRRTGTRYVHLPPWQTRPCLHTLPQRPQLAESLAVSTQVP